MNRYYILFLFLFNYNFSVAQENFNGVIYDVGTRLPLDRVLVQSINPNQFTNSNELGYFSIDLNTENDGFPNAFNLENNIVYWSLNQNVSIKLFSIDGAHILTKKGAPSGQWQLPIQAAAYYFLLIQYEQHEAHVMLLSDGDKYTVVRKNIPPSSFPLLDSILFFLKLAILIGCHLPVIPIISDTTTC